MADEYEYEDTTTGRTMGGGDTQAEQDTTRKTTEQGRVIEQPPLADDQERTYVDETVNVESLSIIERQRLKRRGRTPNVSSVPLELTSVKIQKIQKFIDARGEFRKININGTEGAGFSVVIRDSGGKNILELSDVRIPRSGTYVINQKFPSIVTSCADTVVLKTYNVVITPYADVKADFIRLGGSDLTLRQYGDTTVTISPVTTQTSPAISMTTGGSGISRKQKAGIYGYNIPNHNLETYNVTYEEDSLTSGLFYVKDASFNKNLTTNSIIKKVVDTSGENGYTNQLQLNPKTTRTRVVDGESVISSDLKAGMKVSLKIEKNKIVTKSLEVVDDEQETTRFDLNNTTDLFTGMQLKIRGFQQVSIVSVDCAKSITVSGKVRIKENTDVIFKYKTGSSISGIAHQNNSKGQTVVNLFKPIYVPDKAELEFDDNNSIVSGTISFSGSGSKSVSTKSLVSYFRYGTSNVTYSLDVDNMITRIPNARHQDVEFDECDSTKTINVIKNDYDENASAKVVTITSGTSHGSTVISGTSITYTPVKGFTGADQLKFTVSDGTNNSLEKTIRIIVK